MPTTHEDANGASIGPRRFRRGCRLICSSYAARDSAASIGPRRFRRGCYLPTIRGSVIVHASIGPRRFRRGCPRRRRRSGNGKSGFNRAATFPSRMPATTTATARRAPCFNRAATFPSRMHTPALRLVDWRVRASIGPRRFRRGCERRAAKAAQGLCASIGPRRFRRGCIMRNRNVAPLRLASIGPRRFRRGCLLSEAQGNPVQLKLQLGRDVSVADADDLGLGSHLRGRFNRAATFPSRMLVSPWAYSRDMAGFNRAATFPSRMPPGAKASA